MIDIIKKEISLYRSFDGMHLVSNIAIESF